MSANALAQYETARREQLTRNEARRIRTKVTDARSNPHSLTAGARWPFELCQNACDGQARPGKSKVNITIDWKKNASAFELSFSHDGAPFRPLELAALLSGGSSKDFDSEQTTGRFGTGFLVTHVLALKTNLRVLHQTDSGVELVELTINRGGEEEDILKNTEECNRAIEAAVPLSDWTSIPSAQLEYLVEDFETMSMGLKWFEDALPYMYSTCQELGTVSVRRPDGTMAIWRLGDTIEHDLPGGTIRCQAVEFEDQRGVTKLVSLRAALAGTTSYAIAVLDLNAGGSHFRAISDDFPRFFRKFPVLGSSHLGISFVLDANFDLNQERERIQLTEKDRESISSALGAVPILMKFAIQQGWSGYHRLFRAEPAAPALASNEKDRDWWKWPCPGPGGILKGESPKMVFTKTSINKNRRFPNEREPKNATKRQWRNAQFARHELACHSAARIGIAFERSDRS